LSWRIADISSDPNGPAILVNGAPLSGVVLTEAQFASAVVRSVTTSHDIWVRASTDGVNYSAPTDFTLSPPPSSVLASVASTTSEAGESTTDVVAASSFQFSLQLVSLAPIPIGSLVVTDGGGLEISGPSAASVTFAGSTGTLQLDHSASFTGSIAGFSGQDQIDLRDIPFSPQLGVTEIGSSDERTTGVEVTSGNLAGQVTLFGNYLAMINFTDDGHGGTMLGYAPPGSTISLPMGGSLSISDGTLPVGAGGPISLAGATVTTTDGMTQQTGVVAVAHLG
jgi:hypothetical protein